MQVSDWESLHQLYHETLLHVAFSVSPKVPREFAVNYGGAWFLKYGGPSGLAKLLDKDQDGVDNAEDSLPPIGSYCEVLENKNPQFGVLLQILKDPPQTPGETFDKMLKEMRYIGLTRDLHKATIIEAARQFPLAKNILVWKNDMQKMDYEFLHNSLSMEDFAQEVARQRLGIPIESVCGSPIEFGENGVVSELRPSEKVYRRNHYVARRGNIFAKRGVEIFVTDDIRPLWDGIVASTLSPYSKVISTFLVKRWPQPTQDLVVKIPHARQDMTQLTYAARLSELIYLVSVTTDPKAEQQKTVRAKLLENGYEQLSNSQPEVFSSKLPQLLAQTDAFIEDYYLFVELRKLKSLRSSLGRTRSLHSGKEYAWKILESLRGTVFEISLRLDWLKDVIEKWNGSYQNRNWWN